MVHRSHGWSLVRCFGRNQFPGCDGRCVQGPGTYSPRHADPRLLAISTSCSRVAENNPNWGNLSGFAPPYSLASHCHCHCSTCVAQPIRAMRTWRHPHLPPVSHWQSLVSAARTFFFVSERGAYYYHYVPHHFLAFMPSLPPPPTRRRRNQFQPNLHAHWYFDVTIGRSPWVLGKTTSVHTWKCFERHRLPMVKFLLKAQLRAGTQSSSSAGTSLGGNFSLGACLSNTKRGFRSL